MMRASTPPTRKKTKAVPMYRRPIFLWSVVLSQPTSPVAGWRGARSGGGGGATCSSNNVTGAPARSCDLHSGRRHAGWSRFGAGWSGLASGVVLALGLLVGLVPGLLLLLLLLL